MPEQQAQCDQLNILGQADLMKDLRKLGAESDLGRPLSLILIDLDQFKQVNDLYGHEVGTLVLRGVVSEIKTVSESQGNAYRYGGDEFVVLLPNKCLREAAATAERIREGVFRAQFEGYPEKATASIGVASCPESTPRAEELFGMADAAMYHAKEFGGNLVRVAARNAQEECNSVNESVRVIRSDIASKVEAVELWMTLQYGINGRGFTVFLENDNDEDVIVEGLSLRKGTLYLCRFAKPKTAETWLVPARGRRSISGEFPSDPTAALRMMNPPLASGVIFELDIVARARILGRLRNLSHTILATASQFMITQFSL